MSKHIVETTEKADLISQEGKMVVVKKECDALIDDEIIKHLTGQIKLTSSKDDLIKYLENKAWELKEENLQLKKVVRECKKFPFKVREALSSGTNVFDVTYHVENEIYKVTKEIVDE